MQEQIYDNQNNKDFKINIIFNEKGEKLETIVERAFKNYYLKNQ